MRGEMKLTYKTFLLNGETSDTNDNVKTKINTKHMKPDNGLVLSHSFLAHIARLKIVRVFVSSHPCMK